MLAEIVRHGTTKEAAAAMARHPGTIKGRLTRLHAETGLTTVQLVYAMRNEIALYLALVPLTRVGGSVRMTA
jgi:sugar diacid utilization regulator